MMRVKEAAARLTISADTVYSLVSAGKLRCLRLGHGRGAIRITEEHLDEYIAGAESRPTQTAKPVSPKLVKSRYFYRN